ncbi:MAG: hypothetical protein RR346_03835 [Bacteroidales bacterium]
MKNEKETSVPLGPILPDMIVWKDDVFINRKNKTVVRAGSAEKLTNRELHILTLFVTLENEDITIEKIHEHFNRSGRRVENVMVARTHLSRLRRKLTNLGVAIVPDKKGYRVYKD